MPGGPVMADLVADDAGAVHRPAVGQVGADDADPGQPAVLDQAARLAGHQVGDVAGDVGLVGQPLGAEQVEQVAAAGRRVEGRGADDGVGQLVADAGVASVEVVVLVQVRLDLGEGGGDAGAMSLIELVVGVEGDLGPVAAGRLHRGRPASGRRRRGAAAATVAATRRAGFGELRQGLDAAAGQAQVLEVRRQQQVQRARGRRVELARRQDAPVQAEVGLQPRPQAVRAQAGEGDRARQAGEAAAVAGGRRRDGGGGSHRRPGLQAEAGTAQGVARQGRRGLQAVDRDRQLEGIRQTRGQLQLDQLEVRGAVALSDSAAEAVQRVGRLGLAGSESGCEPQGHEHGAVAREEGHGGSSLTGGATAGGPGRSICPGAFLAGAPAMPARKGSARIGQDAPNGLFFPSPRRERPKLCGAEPDRPRPVPAPPRRHRPPTCDRQRPRR